MRHKHLSLLTLLLIMLGSAVTASSQVLNPCTPGLTKAENIIPVKNEVQVYCVSDYGWSDSDIPTVIELGMQDPDDHVRHLAYGLATNLTNYLRESSDRSAPPTDQAWSDSIASYKRSRER